MPKSDSDIGGVVPYFSAAVGATAVLVASGQTLLYGWQIKNPQVTIGYLQIFDAAAAADVTVGTTVRKLALGLAASGIESDMPAKPVAFGLGIVIACTTTATGNTANAMDVNLLYA